MKSDSGLQGFRNTVDSAASQRDSELRSIQGRYTPGVILLITILGIVIAEVIAMIVVYYYRYLPYYQQVLMDAITMAAIIFPILYFLSFRPLLLHIQQRFKVESVIQSRLRLIQFANTHTLNEILQFTLDEIEFLTHSSIGYFHFLEADQTTLRLQAWSTNTVKNMCSVTSIDTHYAVDKAGVWADCVRQRQPVIHNDYGSLPSRKGIPKGHAPVIREMAVPIMRNTKIVAILGIGNKPRDFTVDDVEIVSTLADFAWDIVRQKQAGDALRQSEEKFRTLVDWTYDWEMWLDPHGEIIYNSPSCERITGYLPEAFTHEPDLLVTIVHQDDQLLYKEHQQLIHEEDAGVERLEYRVVAQNGEMHWIEHICRPLFGEDQRYLGRRISNRDITDRKKTEKEITDRNQKERTLMETIHTMQLDIARDLHDTVGQNISLLRMKLDYLADSRSLKKSDMQVEIQNMTKVAHESYDLLRGTLAVLQYGESGDLFRVFSRYAEQIEARSTFQVEFLIEGTPKALSAKRMRQLFYVFRETLNNIEKHACATKVSIWIIWNDEHLVFTVSDNGHGFPPSDIEYGSHFGLKFMRDRVEMLNGFIDIDSKIDAGTTIQIKVPYE